jgi:hypothetical protein
MAASDEKLGHNDHMDRPSKGTVSQKDVEGLPVIDYVAEAKLIRKLDWMIVPPVMLLYLFSFLDRVCSQTPKL